MIERRRREHKAIVEAHRKGTTPPWNTKLGGEVFVHGRGSKSDWTLGCIALDDSDIDSPMTIPPKTYEARMVNGEKNLLTEIFRYGICQAISPSRPRSASENNVSEVEPGISVVVLVVVVQVVNCDM